MVRFGGNEFTTFSVPLSFEGRYFILTPGDPPQVSVVLEHNGRVQFEVELNEPVDNPLSDVSKTSVGVVTVVDKQTDRFLYKIRPGSDTSVVFAPLLGSEVSVTVKDAYIQVGSSRLRNNLFAGARVGVEVTPEGGIHVSAKIPPVLLEFLRPSC